MAVRIAAMARSLKVVGLSAGQLVAANRYVHLSTSDSSVIEVDVGTPASPRVAGQFADLRLGLSTTVDGSLANVFMGNSLLKIDISDPESATISARMTAAGK
jgi:hypothetical protein